MPIEAATNISELVDTNPVATDNIYEGDDHIRLIKAAIQATFPNIAGTVNLTHTELNGLVSESVDLLSGEVTELKKHLVPKQSVTMWSGAVESLPTGWGLCDGTLQNGILTPDLRNKFIVGAGSDYAVDDASVEGPDFAVSLIGATDQTIIAGSTDEHVLTVDEIPSHRHSIASRSNSNGGSNYVEDANSSGTAYTMNTGFEGGGLGHSHELTGTTHEHAISDIRPAWYALAYIIKLTEYVAPAV